MDDSHTANRAHADTVRRIHDLHGRLQNLAEANPLPDRSGVNGWLRVFGSNGHRWVSHPVPRDSLDQLCRYLGTRLPAEFEEFLRGCGNWTVLAITGELAGTVWDVDCHGGEWNERADWWPASYPGHEQLAGRPIYFLDWYEHWLNLNSRPVTT